jgi:hypothetical protein
VLVAQSGFQKTAKGALSFNITADRLRARWSAIATIRDQVRAQTRMAGTPCCCPCLSMCSKGMTGLLASDLNVLHDRTARRRLRWSRRIIGAVCASVRWSNRRAYELLRWPPAVPVSGRAFLAEADVSGAGRVRSRFNLGSKSALVSGQAVSPGLRTPGSGTRAQGDVETAAISGGRSRESFECRELSGEFGVSHRFPIGFPAGGVPCEERFWF